MIQDDEIWLVYVPASHPGGPPIGEVRADFFQDLTGGALKIYRHAFAFSFADPCRCRRLVATRILAPLQPMKQGATAGATVMIQYGAPKGRGWGVEDLGTEFRVNWKWWRILKPEAKPDDLLRKIFIELGTEARRRKKLPMTIPVSRFDRVWDVQRLFGRPWEVWG